MNPCIKSSLSIIFFILLINSYCFAISDEELLKLAKSEIAKNEESRRGYLQYIPIQEAIDKFNKILQSRDSRAQKLTEDELLAALYNALYSDRISEKTKTKLKNIIVTKKLPTGSWLDYVGGKYRVSSLNPKNEGEYLELNDCQIDLQFGLEANPPEKGVWLTTTKTERVPIRLVFYNVTRYKPE